ncbi:MAG: hypothetical protein ACK56W_12740, partial [Pirellula sp.]
GNKTLKPKPPCKMWFNERSLPTNTSRALSLDKELASCEVKFSTDSNQIFENRDEEKVWSERLENATSRFVMDNPEFWLFQFINKGKAIVGIDEDCRLKYGVVELAPVAFTLCSLPSDTNQIYVDPMGEYSIVYSAQSIMFFPLPSCSEITRLINLQTNSKQIGNGIAIASSSYPDYENRRTDVVRNPKGLQAVGLLPVGRHRRSSPNGFVVQFDVSERFLERYRLTEEDGISRYSHRQVLNTTPFNSVFSDPLRKFPITTALSRDGVFYLTLLAPEKSAQVFACDSGKVVWEKEIPGNKVHPLAVDEDSALFRIDATLHRFDFSSDNQHIFHAPGVIDVASVSPDEKTVACLASGTIHLVSCDTMQELKSWVIPQRGAHSIEWALGGKRLFVYSTASMCICDPERGELLINFNLDEHDDHWFAPNLDIAVFGGRVVSSRPFREHWKQWHETWTMEDSRENRSKSIDYLNRLLGSSQEEYDSVSEWRRITNEKIMSTNELSTTVRVHAIETFDSAVSFIEDRKKRLITKDGKSGSRSLASSLFMIWVSTIEWHIFIAQS